MKLSIILITVFILISDLCYSQGSSITLDSLESEFVSVWKDIKMPCQWKMDSKRNANGKLTFFDKDSSAIEFDFFKASSLPFYTSIQTDYETTKKYYKWALKKSKKLKNNVFIKVEENKKAGFIIYKIKDASGEFYRIFARHHDFVFSTKIFKSEISVESQLDKLRLLHDLNKN
jgi:hypothetical protein